MSGLFPDNPDFQNAIVTAQSLLASKLETDTSATFALPANCEMLLITLNRTTLGAGPKVTGATTGYTYPVWRYPFQNVDSISQTYVCAVQPAVDGTVTVSFLVAPGVTWTVASDAGIRAVLDPALVNALVSIGSSASAPGILEMLNFQGVIEAAACDNLGQQFVVPAAPGTLSGSAPGNEILTASNPQSTSAGTLVAAPGGTKRLRLLAYTLTGAPGASSNSAGVLQTGSGFSISPFVYPGQTLSLTLPLSGFALAHNESLFFGMLGSAPVYGVSVHYTVEFF